MFALKSETYNAVKLLLQADSSVPPEQRSAILTACRKDVAGNHIKREAMVTTKQAAGILQTCSKTVLMYGVRGLLTPCRRSQRAIRWRLSEVEQLATEGAGSNQVGKADEDEG